MREIVQRFLCDDSGATAIEYAIIASMLSIVIVGGVSGLGPRLKDLFSGVSAGFN
jgi:pilus assembly protein Flp/PilA